ncbi:DNA-deoxyinosine glycosylase [Elongatibacter sediminis]|uniref:DNA-deoxyinosine glycosylase n=1 Tax=Elongatibacter sediminis TaxID=3119006 RepID=A0AAW9RAY5_9GAMM
MPSVKSLAEHQYYGHPRNAFWPIMREILALPCAEYPDYASLTRAVAGRGFAIWDVLQSCHRPGSLDAAIEPGSVVVNRFDRFLGRYPGIDRIFFNGTTAERLFRRHALPMLPAGSPSCGMHRLPSTSPAHAALTLEEKLAAWSAIVPAGGLAFDGR